ncbi:hypothetical protein COV82_04745 [Candidatus Peregrinibacteria bacterium CG11_big_fil_rev_8_21_14_0_20_46_8]|nr:MAG: hypothetical protein COV82_04745 [Candidatus Peregrinibacteria bacterium CG11_big_fil_rev_8_21_14_0_20_46_8]
MPKKGFKALLLAAGRSTRMAPIDDKNALRLLGKPLIQYQLEALTKVGYTDIALVGGKHNLDFLREVAHENKKATARRPPPRRGKQGGASKAGQARITIIEQKKLQDGMAGAILAAEQWIAGKPILVLSGNDLVQDKAFNKFKRPGKDGLLLAKKVSTYFPGGYLTITQDGTITKIVEKPGAGKEPSDLVNIVVHYHPDSAALIQSLKNTKSKYDDVYEAALQRLFAAISYRAVVYDASWLPVKYPWHVLDVMEKFLPTSPSRGSHAIKKGRGVKIAKSAIVNGPVILDDGVRILDNAVVQGPVYIGKNSLVATGALIRGSHIGDNCVIGFGSEVARSFIGDNVWTHTNYIGDSIIGNNVSFGAGTVTGNLRLDEGNILVDIKGEAVDTGRTKLGIVTGNNIRVGINTSFMPGKKIGSDSMIGAGIVVAQDIPDGSFVYGKSELVIKKNTAKIPKRDVL